MSKLEEIKYGGNGKRYETFPTKVYCPHCKKWFVLNLHIDKALGEFDIKSYLQSMAQPYEGGEE